MKKFNLRTTTHGDTIRQHESETQLTVDMDRRLGLEPSSKFVCIVSPPIPDGWRLAKIGESLNGKAQYWSYARNRWNDACNHSQDGGYIYILPEKPQIEVSIKVNGKEMNPAELSEESWLAIRNGNK